MSVAPTHSPARNSAWKAGLVLIALVLAACVPMGRTIANPKEGDVIDLAAGQPLQVMLTNNKGEGWAWTWKEEPLKILAAKGASVRPAVDGGMEQNMFDFTTASPGAEHLTFAYRQKGAAPEPADEVVTITVKVK